MLFEESPVHYFYDNNVPIADIIYEMKSPVNHVQKKHQASYCEPPLEPFILFEQGGKHENEEELKFIPFQGINVSYARGALRFE
eukprot:12846583-Ditylum_brightwellii.AAC.2